MLFTPIKPMLLHMGNEIEDDYNRIFDIKWDGWRIILHKDGQRVEAYTRHGNNVTNKFPELSEAAQSIKSNSAILDCEGVVIRDGVSSFEDFAYRGLLSNPERIKEATKTHPVTFVVFDVISTDKSHVKEPLIERKERLNSLIEPSNALVVTPYVIGEGSSLFKLTKERNMEGIVSKRLDSSYEFNKRSYDWLKHKHFKITSTVIIGYKENPFAMIVGQYFSNGQLRAVAIVEFGFSVDEKKAFREIAKGIVTKKVKGVNWVKPELCCNVQYLEETDNHKLRIVSFKGFNFDIKPEKCVYRNLS